MKTRVLLVALLAAAFPSGPARAFLDNTGGSAAQFLRIGAGARSYGMGDAFVAVAEGPDALYWNTAGLAALKRPAFAYTRAEPAHSIHHDFAAYGHPVKLLKGALGVSLTYQSQDSLPVVTNGNLETGRFTPHAEAVSVAYATQFQSGEVQSVRDYFGEKWNIPGLSRPLSRDVEPWTGAVMAGLGVKYVRESIHGRSGSAILYDGGVLFRPSYLKGLVLGFAFRNVGERLKFINRGQMAPVELDAGVSYDWPLKNSRLITAAGVGLPYFGSPEGRVGFEYGLQLSKTAGAALRLGFSSRTFDDLGMMTAFTAGVGMSLRSATLDIGIKPMAELGVGYKVSLGYRF
ncbi:MAG: hypothetical protein HZB91_02000 [Elusimicrobia bacterium]|nr:hypothetical protein [Elusimicrobiota bacterium]